MLTTIKLLAKLGRWIGFFSGSGFLPHSTWNCCLYFTSMIVIQSESASPHFWQVMLTRVGLQKCLMHKNRMKMKSQRALSLLDSATKYIPGRKFYGSMHCRWPERVGKVGKGRRGNVSVVLHIEIFQMWRKVTNTQLSQVFCFSQFNTFESSREMLNVRIEDWFRTVQVKTKETSG